MRLAFLFFLFLPVILFSQNFGIELRAYPAGQMFLLRASEDKGQRHEWLFSVGYNNTDRKDFGVHSNEEGGGFGGLVGYRYYLMPRHENFYVGFEQAIWFLTVDWEDNNPFDAGTTDIMVFQPAFNGGYKFRNKTEKWFGEIGLAFGREINVKTEGERVGQGGISMVFAVFGIRI